MSEAGTAIGHVAIYNPSHCHNHTAWSATEQEQYTPTVWLYSQGNERFPEYANEHSVEMALNLSVSRDQHQT